MAKKVPGVSGELVVDMRKVARFLGYTGTLVKEMNDPEFRRKILRGMEAYHRYEFGQYADRAARENGQSLHHVYEWGRIGKVNGRLFRVVSVGAGTRKTLYYEFLQSRKYVRLNPRGPADIDKRQERHVFRHKAWVLENVASVWIAPTQARFLAWFDESSGKMVYSWDAVEVNIGKHTVGKFAKLWNQYWLGIARPRLETVYGPTFEDVMTRDFSRVTRLRGGSKTLRAHPGMAGFNVRVLTGAKEYAQGATQARAAAKKLSQIGPNGGKF
jgi:hypothetical protein